MSATSPASWSAFLDSDHAAQAPEPDAASRTRALFCPAAAFEPDYRATRQAVLEALDGFGATARVTVAGARHGLTASFDTATLPEGTDAWGGYLTELTRSLLDGASNLSAARCLGHMSGVVPAFLRIVAELIVGTNQNVVRRDASPLVTSIEHQTLTLLHRLVYGSPARTEPADATSSVPCGIVTSGGTLGNIVALWCARNAAFPAAGEFSGPELAGMGAALQYYQRKRAVIVGSALMHYSVDKAAALLGLGSDAVLRVPVNHDGCVDVPALVECIEDCERRDWAIIAMIGVAGSTDCGSVDSLQDLVELAERHALHLHVDAAWGGPLLFSPEHRSLLRGIERADSVTIDGHKQLWLPLGMGALLLRRPELLGSIEKRANYILQHGSDDLGRFSFEGSRPAHALFAHAALHVIGAQGYAFLVEDGIRKASALARLITQAPDFELLVQPTTNIVTYRWHPAAWQERVRARALTWRDNALLNAANEQLQKLQTARGQSYVSRTLLRHVRGFPGVPLVALRAVLMNPRTTEGDLQAVLEEQREIAASTAALGNGQATP